MQVTRKIMPGQFEPDEHFYLKVLNTQMHSLVNHFFNLDHERLIKRYLHLNPSVSAEVLQQALLYPTRHFYWGGADLFYVTTSDGSRKMVVLETNSCPSGQKSMPQRTEADDYRGYRKLLEEAFLPRLRKRRLPDGDLAVLYDKNLMENSGYAATLADLMDEPVWLVPCHNSLVDTNIQFRDGVLWIRDDANEWRPIRGALRYVTQKPWNRIPIQLKTFLFNPVLVCLAGGRNKLVAQKSYELYNSELYGSGLKIYMPETIKDVSQNEVPLWVQKLGGRAVVKVPYLNAGQGVFTITHPAELDHFMSLKFPYQQFVVQSLIGHSKWSSRGDAGHYYHIGTIPNRRAQIYIADLRMMVYSTPEGFRPCAVYARRALQPMEESPPENSWEVLGTNLSKKLADDDWTTDVQRLITMDTKDFNSLGIGIDDLIEAYLQTVLAVTAIDKMAERLLGKQGQLRRKLFGSLDNDVTLMNEIIEGGGDL